MRHLMMLINIVLFVVMLVRRSIQVQHLDTGYMYAVGEKGNGREKDLKCAFWYSGKMHLQLTKLLFTVDGLVPSTLKAISDFQTNTEIHLAVLYNLRSERIGALWLVHLYVSQVAIYHDYLVNDLHYTDRNIVDKMAVVHDYIIEKLEFETVVHCTEGNRFDWSKKQFAGKQLSSDNVKAMIEQNTREMNAMLAKNDLTEYDNKAGFKVCNILMLNNDVWQSFDRVVFNDFNRFNVNVGWRNTKNAFARQWRQTRDMDFASNHLKPIRSYLSMVLDMFKVIVMRMTWKHLEFMKQATRGRRPAYALKWLHKIQDFAAIGYLHTDTHIRYLLGAFEDKQIQSVEFIEPLIRYIKDELTTLAESLSCEATRPFTPLVGNIPDYNPENANHLDEMIKMDGLVKANQFNTFLQENIIKHDFGITRALLNYIDEPKPYELFE